MSARASSLLLPALVGLALLASGCSAKGEISLGDSMIDSERAEKEISGGLEDAYGTPPKSLDCPADVKAEEGKSFTCTGEDPDGRPFQLDVVMTDDEGGIRYPTTVEFTDGATGA